MKYTIGELSKISKISNRMLRYLDKEDLLKPSFIGDNGYRYYSDSELEKASKITRLKKYYFTYAEIKDILEKCQEDDHDVYLSKLQNLKSVVGNYDKLILELEQDFSENNNTIINCYDVQVTQRHLFYALEKRSLINAAELESFIEENVNQLSKQPLALLGNYYIAFYNAQDHEEDFSDEDQLDIGFYQPIRCHSSVEGFETRFFENAICISTIHYGSYDQIYKGYKALYLWAEGNGYQINDEFFEKYFVDAYFTQNQNDYVTEISVIVSKND